MKNIKSYQLKLAGGKEFMSNQIVQFVQENELFSEMSAEEAATISGGGRVAGAVSGLYATSGGLLNNRVVQAGIFANAINPTLL